MRRHEIVAFALLTIAVLGSCAPRSAAAEITREHAIEIARRQVTFDPQRIEAARGMSGAAPVWRVVFTGRLPGQPPGLFETVVVEVDRRNGDLVSIARP